MAPPAAAIAALAPGPVPPPVAGAPNGRPVLVALAVPVGNPVGKALEVPVGLAVAVALLVPVGSPVGKPLCVPLGVGEAEHEGEAEAVTEARGEALTEGEDEAEADVLAVAEADGEALAVGAQLVVGDGLHEGLGLAVIDAEALTEAEGEDEALAELLGEADAVAQLAAAAVPPSGPVNATNATEPSRAATPAARPTSPARCSFSQLICRDRRKIVTVPRVVRLVHPGSQVPSHYINAQYPKTPVTATISVIPGEHSTTNSGSIRLQADRPVKRGSPDARLALPPEAPRRRWSPPRAVARGGPPGGGMTGG